MGWQGGRHGGEDFTDVTLAIGDTYGDDIRVGGGGDEHGD